MTQKKTFLPINTPSTIISAKQVDIADLYYIIDQSGNILFDFKDSQNNSNHEKNSLDNKIKNEKVVSIFKLIQNNIVIFIIKSSGFYGEKGGQVADTGYFIVNNIKLDIIDVQWEGNVLLHYVRLAKLNDQSKNQESTLKKKFEENEKQNDKFSTFSQIENKLKNMSFSAIKVKYHVNTNRNKKIRVHHTATHLLHNYLHSLGGSQCGSLVSADKLRFDYDNVKMDISEIEKMEFRIRDLIGENENVWEEHIDKKIIFNDDRKKMNNSNSDKILLKSVQSDDSIEKRTQFDKVEKEEINCKQNNNEIATKNGKHERNDNLKKNIEKEKICNQKTDFEYKNKKIIINFSEEETYPSIVRLIHTPTHIELCGGHHVSSLSQIKDFVVISDSTIAKNIRRMVVVCGDEAFQLRKCGELQYNTVKQQFDQYNTLCFDEKVQFLKQKYESVESKIKFQKDKNESFQKETSQNDIGIVLSSKINEIKNQMTKEEIQIRKQLTKKYIDSQKEETNKNNSTQSTRNFLIANDLFGDKKQILKDMTAIYSSINRTVLKEMNNSVLFVGDSKLSILGGRCIKGRVTGETGLNLTEIIQKMNN